MEAPILTDMEKGLERVKSIGREDAPMRLVEEEGLEQEKTLEESEEVAPHAEQGEQMIKGA
jgi:hypothetical protein